MKYPKFAIIVVLSLYASTMAYAQKEISSTTDSVYTKVEKLPSFEGGMTSLYSYFQTKLIYPSEAKKKNIEGKVIVEFIVLKNGVINSSKVLRGIGYGCDKAALELINNMPNWSPGKQQGKTVNVRMVLPISFKLN